MTFTNLPDLYIVKGRLETDGIECFVQDEYIMQFRPDTPYAYGGIKLQTNEEDAEKAVNILKEYGYFQEEDHIQSKFIASLDQLTGKFPLLRKYPLHIKLLAIVFFILSAVILFYAFKYGEMKW